MSGSVPIRATLGVVLAAGVLTVASCTGRAESTKAAGADNVSTAEASFVVEEMIDRAMAAYGVADAAMPPDAGDRPASLAIDAPVDMSRESALGGQIVVTGRVTGTASPADRTMSLTLGATETLTGFKFDASGITYTVNGAPSVAAAGTMTASGSGAPPETHLTLKGAFVISRGGAERTCAVDVAVQTTQAGSELKGTVCGDRIRRLM